MIIANPIYDEVFKLLMSNARLARFFIATILDETILDVEYKPQEIPYGKDRDTMDAAVSIAVFRLDFVATVKTGDGTHKKILIEIQKTRKFTDIMRFRNYLGEHYKHEEEVLAGAEKKKMPLPIITIYLLGFRFPHVAAAAIKVARNYVDLDTGDVIQEKEDFMELLTHDCYVVQIPRIEGRLQSRLQKLLSFFEQRYFTDDTGMIKQYNYPIDEQDEDMKLLARTLNFACTDPESRRMMEAEQAALRMINIGIDELEKELLEKDKELLEKNKEITEKDKKIEMKDQEIAELRRRLGI
jgi:hypothetical protein